MTAEPIREMRPRTIPLGDLAMIEFQSNALSTGDSMNDNPLDLADHWLEGQSDAMERLRLRATGAGRDGVAVTVIQGESGSGKLRVAQWIHRCSRRAARPLMILDANCEMIVEQIGRVIRSLNTDSELAPGTLAIRNFQDLSVHALQRLLELLTLQGVELRCGLALMTTQDIGALRARSLQHAQLLGRVANAALTVPPLRQREGDIAFLARRFVHEAAKRYHRPVRGISPQAIGRLEHHAFPGNIHELRAMIEQAVLRSSGDWITAECFPGIGDSHRAQAIEQSEVVIRLPGSSLREIEIQALKLALKLSGGRIVRASELLGITRHALRRKLEKFGLNGLRSQPEVVSNPAEYPTQSTI